MTVIGWRSLPMVGFLVAGILVGLPAVAQDPLRVRECLVKPSASVEVGGPSLGLLEDVMVDRGDRVERGQPLARLTSDMEAVAVKIAETRAASQASIESGRSRVSFYRAQGQRSARLAQKNLVSREDLERTRTEEALAVAELAVAELEHELAKLEGERARVQLEQRTIRSPIDGLVSRRHMHPGEYVNEQTPLFTLVAIDPLHVEAFLPIEHYADIQEGMSLSVETSAPFEGRHEARVDAIDRVFDAASGTFGVRLIIDNDDFALPAGIRCNLLLPGASSIGPAD